MGCGAHSCPRVAAKTEFACWRGRADDRDNPERLAWQVLVDVTQAGDIQSLKLLAVTSNSSTARI